MLPGARIAMVTSDTLNSPEKINAFVAAAEGGEIDVIVGPRAEARGARRHAPASPAMSVVITHYNTRI